MAARIAVVGGGILGLAVARRLGQVDPTATVTVFEKEQDIARHQTGRNSGVVHAGLYYTPGSLKATLCRRGVGLLREYVDDRKIRFEECGKVVVAVDDTELDRLNEIARKAEANGVPGCRWLDPAELREIEPHARGVAALHSPTTAIVDYPAVCRALRDDVLDAGGTVRTGTEIVGIEEKSDGVWLRLRARGTAAGPPNGHHPDGASAAAKAEVREVTEQAGPFDLLVSCAGLQSDQVAQLTGEDPSPRIIPFRGDYWLLRPERRDLVKGLIYPVPDPRYPFLGIHLTKRVDGEILVGPNAVLATAREGYTVGTVKAADLRQTVAWPGMRKLALAHWKTGAKEMLRTASKRAFVAEARRYVPELTAADVVRGPAGVRAQAVARDGSLVDDFVLAHSGRILHVRNAPSPGATASLAIAEHIVAKLVPQTQADPAT
ncbi:L-2-hydroxyglutarate oxidase [Frankia sp. AgB1.9]|uniref:L-2-hydroxyglutarate oxidase n=1 Tax=unclassified Frankia TaxID=2632575 RepID=UPI0019329E40|nr:MULTISPECIES: L-2-hydroxyglutarate oxidase [unclassified Frankia]MBL7486704.1 L-2-hydroxyglutarate oxidase [Frankia sp. AgW1.1]MBL7553332.1 L-2-hydroxyglutarate oxidase [Frankia sp. AgB1.9]MBL7624835.1 L-2-hydroxyglutarate oxidase [Frankia sp. AgB1.8]